MTFQGYVYRDPFGRTFIDECPSSEHHLRYSVVKEGDDRARCRVSFDALFDAFVGRKGRIEITIKFTEDANVQNNE